MDMHRYTHRFFQRFAAILLAYAIIIILWGAYVRISGSGDGCGSHWPLCHGTLFLSEEFTQQIKTWIEFAHRMKSGIFGVLVLIFALLAHKYSPSLLLKKASLGTLFFTFIEAILGALLVLNGWVGNDKSVGRLLMSAAHLGNTLLLLATLVSTACLPIDATFREIKDRLRPVRGALCAVLLLCCTGAWAALGSTIAPSDSLTQGILHDLSPESALPVQLRVIHPSIALIIAFYIIRYAMICYKNHKTTASTWLLILSILQPIIGISTLLALSPTILKLLHLLGADLLWIAFLWTALTSSNEGEKTK